MQRFTSPFSKVSDNRFGRVLFVLLMALAQPAAAATTPAPPADHSWALLTGYGYSQPGWGRTRIRVETLDLVLRHELVLTETLGSSWYQGYHSLLIEAPLHLVLTPDVGPMFALNFLANYTFTQSETHRPYIFAGGGPVYNTVDIPGMGADLNGNYQLGLGWKYRMNSEHELLFEYRYHHISNNGAEEPNDPLNSNKFIVGTTF